jgi:hypothetical protein
MSLEAVMKLITGAFSPVQETLAGRVLHDAVYDFLGRVDFPSMADKLYREELAYGKVTDPVKWFADLEQIIAENPCLTSTARMLQSVSREDQVTILRTFSEERLGNI